MLDEAPVITLLTRFTAQGIFQRCQWAIEVQKLDCVPQMMAGTCSMASQGLLNTSSPPNRTNTMNRR